MAQVITTSADTNSTNAWWDPSSYITQTENGLQVRGTNVLVVDVMEAYIQGKSNYQICYAFDLTPLRVQKAIQYIEKYRLELEQKFAQEIQVRQEVNLSTYYQILDTSAGLAISDSRTLLFDVMEAYDEGDSIYTICETFNLTPHQVETAIDYIEKHRADLEPKLVRAIQFRQEQEAYYRALAEERWAQIEQLPVSPQKAAFRALIEKNRAERATRALNADHSQ